VTKENWPSPYIKLTAKEAKEAKEGKMPLKKVSDFGITMREAEKRTKELTTAADYSNKEAAEKRAENEKAEPKDESEIICHYYTGEEPHNCPGPMGDERHYVIKEGELVLAHKRCHKLASEGIKKTPNVIIR